MPRRSRRKHGAKCRAAEINSRAQVQYHNQEPSTSIVGTTGISRGAQVRASAAAVTRSRTRASSVSRAGPQWWQPGQPLRCHHRRPFASRDGSSGGGSSSEGTSRPWNPDDQVLIPSHGRFRSWLGPLRASSVLAQTEEKIPDMAECRKGCAQHSSRAQAGRFPVRSQAIPEHLGGETTRCSPTC